MKRLPKKEKDKIIDAARDAVFQILAEEQEDLTDRATQDTLDEIDSRSPKLGDDINTWDAVQTTVNREVNAIVDRMFHAISKK